MVCWVFLAGAKAISRKAGDPSDHAITSFVSDVKPDLIQGSLFGMSTADIFNPFPKNYMLKF